MRLSASSWSAVSGVSASISSISMAMDHLKTVGSHFLIKAMLASCSKHGRMKGLHLGMVQNSREIFLESITISFEPKRFLI